MKLTLKKDININSLTLQHNILLRAMGLLEGREGVLKTEKQLYLMIAMIDLVIEEDLLELCNNDDRDLPQILMEDIEPFFIELIDSNNDYNKVFNELRVLMLEHCDRIWSEQHSIVGIIDAILTAIASVPEEDKKQVLEDTSKAAADLFEKRTEIINKQNTEINEKIGELIKQYQKKGKTENDK